ncbi:hypothetical protein J7E38_06550 [Bacillus sp. ISL-35]|uniref:hypothetical protein n=1 Tax=Bacillus sp. ISL-35 TaxID=2819122 RepID=UPI001BE70591|nr:hypothetical protein [Bacillus sp. ISL-35]MBT2678657.1 hypothetical protein [Bacillus sp. ISL-35]MBT2703649.1 hypothetical protein [Chryseobacterium sp. ISL-80]
MVLKTVKGKVVAGVVTVGLLSGMGTAFANTDAGTQLQNWYSKQFNTAKQQSAIEVYNYARGQKNSLMQEKDNLKNAAVTNVATAGKNEVDRANGEINSALAGHVEAINTKEAAITAAMPGQFDQAVSSLNRTVNYYVGQEANSAKNEITTAVNAQGAESVGYVNTEVTETKTDAVAALEAEITAAKAELERLVGEEKAAATSELKANFDAQIVKVRGEITTLIEALEEANTKLIIEKGAEIEAAAKADLDALVNGINN